MFAKVFLEITDVCNLSCSFCPPTRRPAKFMALEEFSFLLDRLEGRVGRLYFHVKGEPLLHPELEGLLRIAGEKGFEVSITTNGSLLDRAGHVLLGARALKKLSVSLHSQADGSEVGDYWRGVEGFLDLHREEPRFPVSLRLWNLRDGRLPEGCAPLWERLRVRYPLVGAWGSPGSWPMDNRLDTMVFLNADEEFAWPDPALPEGGDRGTCLGLRKQIAVLVDGRVLPCCLDGEGRLALGNLFERELDAILAGRRAREIREGFERGRLVEGLCRTCGYRRRFE